MERIIIKFMGKTKYEVALIFPMVELAMLFACADTLYHVVKQCKSEMCLDL